MTSTLMASTVASTSHFLQHFESTDQPNSTKSLIVNLSSTLPIFYHNTGVLLTPEEEFFHRILLKYQPVKMTPRTRLISVYWSTIVGTFFICSTIFGLVGNMAVIVAISGDKIMRRSAMNILLLNLAVADMFNLCTIILEWSPAVIYGYPAWNFPAFLCPLARYLECTFLFSSILSQLMVCIERYIAIVYPIHVRRLCTRQNIFVLALVTWFVALIFSLPYALVHIKPKASIKCINSHGNNFWWICYKWFEFSFAYTIPCTIMIFLYARVACVLWSKNSHLRVTKTQKSLALHADEKTRFEVLYMRRGIIKMLVACVLIYFVSYSPIQGIFIMTAMFGPNSRPPYSVVLLLNALAVTCSSCNPLIYTLFSKKFRSRIIYLLTFGKHGQDCSKNDITCSFVKKFKNQNLSCSVEADCSILLQSHLTPDEPRRYVTLANSVM